MFYYNLRRVSINMIELIPQILTRKIAILDNHKSLSICIIFDIIANNKIALTLKA